MWVWYLQESARIILFEDFQAVLHHARGLAQLHGAVCDLVTYDLEWMWERGQTNKTRRRSYWAALGSVVVGVVGVVDFYRNMPRHNQTAASPFSCPPSSPFQFLLSPSRRQMLSASSHMSRSKIRFWLDVTTSRCKVIETQSTVAALLDRMFTFLTPALHFYCFLVYYIISYLEDLERWTEQNLLTLRIKDGKDGEWQRSTIAARII